LIFFSGRNVCPAFSAGWQRPRQFFFWHR
jgi:hypothetical protein